MVHKYAVELMLEKFSWENYLSFKGKAEITFIPATISEIDKNLYNPSFSRYRILKSLGVFGDNSSGKSNIFKSLEFVRDLILGRLGGVERDGIEKVRPFRLHSKTANSPSSFEIIFWESKEKYRYGFEVDKEKILAEWLLVKATQKEKTIFIRSETEFRIGRGYKGHLDKFSGVVRPNELFLTFAARLSIPFADQIVGWFRQIEIVMELDAREMALETIKSLENPLYKKEVENVMRRSGFGIVALDVLGIGEMKRVMTRHDVFDNENSFVDHTEFDLIVDESLGTIKFFALLGPILKSLRNGSLLIVDELDSGFHTLLGQQLIRLFHNSATKERTAQLLFSSHNQDLWDNDVLRRDQQLHVSRDEFGKSGIKSTYEFKLRKDKSVKRSYSKGKLSRLPLISDYQMKLDL